MHHDRMFVYVEDEPMSRTVMEMLMVRGLGYKNLHIFANSADFIARLEALPAVPDLIFLDIHMQPHDGFEMLQMLRGHEVFAKVLVVALTASVMNEEVDMLKSAGFDSGIAKPIDQTTFSQTLDQILGGEEVWKIF
jgi:CheY-like chemotaxis protein